MPEYCAALVAIPTLGESPYLQRMLAELVYDDYGVDKVLVMDNTPGSLLHPQLDQWQKIAGIGVTKHSGNIYQMWNHAIAWARTFAPPSQAISLAILNDDLVLPRGGIGELCRQRFLGDWAILGTGYGPEAKQEPAPTVQVAGTYRHSGIGGFSFCVDPRFVEPIPDCFSWWYGDDHLVFRTIELGGKVGRLDSVQVKHAQSLTLNAHWHRVAPLAEQDARVFQDRWPGR